MAARRTSMNSRRRRERGSTLVEYALLIALIAITSIVALRTLGSGATNGFDRPRQCLENGQCGTTGSGTGFGGS